MHIFAQVSLAQTQVKGQSRGAAFACVVVMLFVQDNIHEFKSLLTWIFDFTKSQKECPHKFHCWASSKIQSLRSATIPATAFSATYISPALLSFVALFSVLLPVPDLCSEKEVCCSPEVLCQLLLSLRSSGCVLDLYRTLRAHRQKDFNLCRNVVHT